MGNKLAATPCDPSDEARFLEGSLAAAGCGVYVDSFFDVVLDNWSALGNYTYTFRALAGQQKELPPEITPKKVPEDYEYGGWGIDGKDKKFILEKDNGFIYDTQLDCHFFSFCVNY